MKTPVDGVFQSTPGGRFISVNPAFARMLGYAGPHEMVASIQDIATQYYVDPADRRRYQEILRENGSVQNFQFRVRRKNDTMIWVSNSTRALYDASGNIIRYEGVIKDITDQKQAEREKEALQNQLIAARKMESLGTLAGGVAHEFNNILGIIIGNTELALEDVPEWSNAKNYIREIKAACMRAREVVRRILRFVQKMPSEKKPTPFAKTLKESLELIRATIPKPIQLKWDLRCGSETILADPTEINQMVMNLSANSVHAVGKSGTIAVTLERVSLSDPPPDPSKELSPGDYMKLTFKDDGSGMSPDILDRIFEPYFTTKQVNEGLGMGLAVVYGIVKNCDGAIQVHSTVGAGTTVEILIPIHEEKAVQKNAPPGGNGKKARILFLDDEAAIADAARILLTRMGYEVVSETHPPKSLDPVLSNPGGF